MLNGKKGELLIRAYSEGWEDSDHAAMSEALDRNRFRERHTETRPLGIAL